MDTKYNPMDYFGTGGPDFETLPWNAALAHYRMKGGVPAIQGVNTDGVVREAALHLIRVGETYEAAMRALARLTPDDPGFSEVYQIVQEGLAAKTESEEDSE